MPRRTGPLAGTTVLELAGLGPAPYAAMILADLGADVIRVERPGPTPGFLAAPGYSIMNRGKRSIVLDLQRDGAREAFLTLARGADVLLEGNRPGVTERLGIGPDDCLGVNPALVYGRMTGWGQEGPLATTAGHDINYIAITGLLHAIGPAGGPPVPPLNLLGDFGGGGVFLVIGVLAALTESRLTGTGQVVDAAIVDGAAHLLASTHTQLNAGTWIDERGVNIVDGGAPFYAVYETRDGCFVALGSIEAKFFATFVALSGAPVDVADQYDRSAWPAMRAAISELFLTRTRDEWAAVFDGSDACVSPVLGLREAAEHPHVRARGSVVASDDGGVVPGLAPRFSGHPVPEEQSPPPLPGQHTREILREFGLSEDLIVDAVARTAP